jgi:hypothetical protein
VFHTLFLHADTSACYSLLSFAEWWHELSGMSQHLYQCLILARPSSDDRCSPSCRSISCSNRQGKATSRRGIQTRVVIPGAHIVVPSFSKYVAYQVRTSRYQLREKPRQSQRSLKVVTMRAPVRTAYPEIALGGNAQTQCPTRRRIRNTPGPWMKAHLQDTPVVETGMPFSPVPFVIDLLDPNRDSPVKTCSQLTRLPRQSATCVKCTFVVLACSTAALPSVLQVLTHTECQTLATLSSLLRCTSASTAMQSR